MLQADDEQIQAAPLPLSADPATGALAGIFVMAAILSGPVGWVVALIAWALTRRRQPEDRAAGQRVR